MIHALFIILISLSSFALELPPMACPEKVKTLLTEWKATGEWQKEKQGGLKGTFFASPTKKSGRVGTRQKDSGRHSHFQGA